MNHIADAKYTALVNLLRPSGNAGMVVSVVPWFQEKTRTFTCHCGHKVIVPVEALKLEDFKGHPVVHVKFETTKCPKCGGQNYEVLSFCHRYGLLRPTPRPRVKKQKMPMLPFVSGIVCGGAR